MISRWQDGAAFALFVFLGPIVPMVAIALAGLTVIYIAKPNVLVRAATRSSVAADARRAWLLLTAGLVGACASVRLACRQESLLSLVQENGFAFAFWAGLGFVAAYAALVPILWLVRVAKTKSLPGWFDRW